MPEVTVDGCRLWYGVGGSGGPLLQLGGVGFAHENFAAVADAMAREFSVIDVDYRGYGLSDRPEQAYTIRTWRPTCRPSRPRRSSWWDRRTICRPLDQAPSGAGSRYRAEHIADARLCLLDGSGHTNLMEQPERSARLVIDFLKEAS